ncbi:hypothetical protein V1264_012532 [Littorina saxatilis]|uniref:G-protein coupled receptors family 1 profile domain-containing protein n=1 Tax=Littorina saxatilis TaxID=31220 RepID=A0AAN9BXE8_9CAEN
METTYQRNDSFRYLGNSVSLFNSVSLANTASLSNTSVNISANASDTGSYWDRNENLVKIEIAIQGTILYLALFGNIFVLVVLRLRRQKLSRMQWFIIHLTLADIFVAIFNTTPQLIMDITNKFYGDDFLCRFIKYLTVVGMYASSYVLVMAAVDRYVSICHPLTNQTLSPKRIHLMILLAWGLSLVFSVPQIFIFSLHNMGGGGYECYAVFDPPWGLQAWVTWLFLSVYALPFLLLAFCYSRICHVVWLSVDSKQPATWNRPDRGAPESKSFLWRISFRPSSSSGSGNNNSTSLRTRPSEANGHMSGEHAQSLRCLTSSGLSKPRGHQRGVSKSKVKTVKLTLSVVLCYLLCWAPFFVVNMLTVWDQTIAFQGPVFTIIALLASLNSCTNPWIYLAFSGRSCAACTKSERRVSRSWTRSTHVVTASYADSESRCRTSMYDLSRCSSRDASPWNRDTLRTNNSVC